MRTAGEPADANQTCDRMAVGFIRSDMTDVDGAERAITRVAVAHDLVVCEVLVFDARETMPTLKLLETVHRLRARVVITPAPEHIGAGTRALSEANRSILYSGVLVPPRGWHR